MKYTARLLLVLAGACLLMSGSVRADMHEEDSAVGGPGEESSMEESSAPAAGPTLAPYAQCGGMAGVCGQDGQGPCEDAEWADLDCPCSFECTRSSEWYWQCIPKNETEVEGKPVLPAYGQCGGMSGICGQTGAGPCEDASWSGYACPCSYTCTRSTEWYWQCMPKSRRLLAARA